MAGSGFLGLGRHSSARGPGWDGRAPGSGAVGTGEPRVSFCSVKPLFRRKRPSALRHRRFHLYGFVRGVPAGIGAWLARTPGGLARAGSFLRHASAKWGRAQNRRGAAYRGARSPERVRCHLREVATSTRRCAAKSTSNRNRTELEQRPEVGGPPCRTHSAPALRRAAASTTYQLATMAPDAFEGTRPTGGALSTRGASVLANDKAQKRSCTRKPARHTRKQSAHIAQELQSAARTIRTGSAGGRRSSFCEMRLH